jgi:hypothetical protein
MNPKPKPMTRLEEQLRAAKPGDALPDGLHASIMTAVRTAAKPQETHSLSGSSPWLPALTAGLALALAVFWFSNRSAWRARTAETQPLVAAAVTLEQGRQLTERAPGAMLAPLAQEMESVNRDLRGMVDFLVASVP